MTIAKSLVNKFMNFKNFLMVEAAWTDKFVWRDLNFYIDFKNYNWANEFESWIHAHVTPNSIPMRNLISYVREGTQFLIGMNSSRDTYYELQEEIVYNYPKRKLILVTKEAINKRAKEKDQNVWADRHAVYRGKKALVILATDGTRWIKLLDRDVQGYIIGLLTTHDRALFLKNHSDYLALLTIEMPGFILNDICLRLINVTPSNLRNLGIPMSHDMVHMQGYHLPPKIKDDLPMKQWAIWYDEVVNQEAEIINSIVSGNPKWFTSEFAKRYVNLMKQPRPQINLETMDIQMDILSRDSSIKDAVYAEN